MQIRQGKTQISAFIPIEWAEFKDKKRTTWIHIIGLGIKALDGNPQLISRINEQENTIKKMSERLQFFAQRSNVLEEKLNELGILLKKEEVLDGSTPT